MKTGKSNWSMPVLLITVFMAAFMLSGCGWIGSIFGWDDNGEDNNNLPVWLSDFDAARYAVLRSAVNMLSQIRYDAVLPTSLESGAITRSIDPGGYPAEPGAVGYLNLLNEMHGSTEGQEQVRFTKAMVEALKEFLDSRVILPGTVINDFEFEQIYQVNSATGPTTTVRFPTSFTWSYDELAGTFTILIAVPERAGAITAFYRSPPEGLELVPMVFYKIEAYETGSGQLDFSVSWARPTAGPEDYKGEGVDHAFTQVRYSQESGELVLYQRELALQESMDEAAGVYRLRYYYYKHIVPGDDDAIVYIEAALCEAGDGQNVTLDVMDEKGKILDASIGKLYTSRLVGWANEDVGLLARLGSDGSAMEARLDVFDGEGNLLRGFRNSGALGGSETITWTSPEHFEDAPDFGMLGEDLYPGWYWPLNLLSFNLDIGGTSYTDEDIQQYVINQGAYDSSGFSAANALLYVDTDMTLGYNFGDHVLPADGYRVLLWDSGQEAWDNSQSLAVPMIAGLGLAEGLDYDSAAQGLVDTADGILEDLRDWTLDLEDHPWYQHNWADFQSLLAGPIGGVWTRVADEQTADGDEGAVLLMDATERTWEYRLYTTATPPALIFAVRGGFDLLGVEQGFRKVDFNGDTLEFRYSMDGEWGDGFPEDDSFLFLESRNARGYQWVSWDLEGLYIAGPSADRPVTWGTPFTRITDDHDPYAREIATQTALVANELQIWSALQHDPIEEIDRIYEFAFRLADGLYTMSLYELNGDSPELEASWRGTMTQTTTEAADVYGIELTVEELFDLEGDGWVADSEAGFAELVLETAFLSEAT